MKQHKLKPLVLLIGLALAAPAMAVDWSLKESNIYMKFLDGDRLGENADSGDTQSNSDQGQWYELNLVATAKVSPKVEAGFRVQSRSNAAYWSQYGGFGLDNTAQNNGQLARSTVMRLRGAYVQLAPGYGWLNEVRIGSSQWSMFDPFTFGGLKYIDRENINGFYFKGKAGNATWDAARITMPDYLGTNWGNGPTCCGNDNLKTMEATYIAQVRMPIGGAKFAASVQTYSDHIKDAADTNPLDGLDTKTIFRNNVYMLKAEGTPVSGIDVKGAYYHSSANVGNGIYAENWSVTPRQSVNDNAFKLDAAFTALPVQNLSMSYQYFDIGAGYFSLGAARRDSDVLLTEGSETAWFQWGSNMWLGGASSDTLTQVAHPGPDNGNMNFDETASEGVLGWKGHTVVANYEIADTPIGLELSKIGYNSNWQNYSTTGPLYQWNGYSANQDRDTTIGVIKVSHVFRVAGGLDTKFKYKYVKDTDNRRATTSADDAETKDSGYTFTVGKQLHNDLYGSISYGNYSRDITDSGKLYNNDKSIWSARFSYSLGGFELGTVAQWIDGKGDPSRTGTRSDISQYRLKAFAQATF